MQLKACRYLIFEQTIQVNYLSFFFTKRDFSKLNQFRYFPSLHLHMRKKRVFRARKNSSVFVQKRSFSSLCKAVSTVTPKFKEWLWEISIRAILQIERLQNLKNRRTKNERFTWGIQEAFLKVSSTNIFDVTFISLACTGP